MSVSKKIAYLQGLCDGLDISENKKEGKLFRGILDVLSEVSGSLQAIEVDIDDLGQNVLDAFEDIEQIYSEMDETFNLADFDDDCDCDDCNDLDMEFYEMVCPSCDEKIVIDEDTLDEGSMLCYACGEDLEFDLSELDATDDDLS